MNDALFSSAKADWQTPRELFEHYNAIYRFTIDAAANEHNHQLPRWYGPGGEYEDALSQAAPWCSERVWLNPPYGRGIGRWMERAAHSALFGSTVVCLVPARTDTVWWHAFVMPLATKVELLRGRVRFVGAKAGAPFPSAVVIYTPAGGPPVFVSEDGKG